jgi:hypothetical protein
MYGLKNAPKAYSDHFMALLSKLGFVQASSDECLWTLRKGDSYVHNLFHVDDIMCVSNDDNLRAAMFDALASELKIRDEGEISMFLGMRIVRGCDGSFTLSQKSYIEKMAEKFNMCDMSIVDTPCVYNSKLTRDMCPQTPDEKIAAAQLPFQALVGGLIYAVKTRPDIAFAVSDVARFMNCWGVAHFRAAKRILRYLYSTRDKCLLIDPVREPFSLVAFCDANFGDDRDSGPEVDDKHKSQGGYLVFLNGSLVSWRSRRHRSRCLSSMESEYYEACEVAKEIVWCRNMMRDIGYVMDEPTVVYEDNKACIAYSKNNTCHDRTAHIDRMAYRLKDWVKDGTIRLCHVSTSDQLADMMTKAQLKCTFNEHVDRILSGPVAKPKLQPGGEHVTHCNCLTCFVGSAKGVQKREVRIESDEWWCYKPYGG